MNKIYVNNFIDRIIEITGMNYCDNVDVEDFNEDELVLYFGALGELGIILKSEGKLFSIFTSFFYNDFRKSDIENNDYLKEDVAADERMHLEEEFSLFYLKSNISEYPVSSTDDGDYLCPGFISRIGYFDIPYSEKFIKTFVGKLREINNFLEVSDNLQIIKELIKYICVENGEYVNDGSIIKLGKDAKLILSQTEMRNASLIDKHYLGNEYFLFKYDNKVFASDAKFIDIFEKIHAACSVYTDVNYYFDQDNLYLVTEQMSLIQPYFIDRGLYSKIEEDHILIKSVLFMPFSGEKFKAVFYDNFYELSNQMDGPLIITEGTTDWMHLKKHWESMRYTYDNRTISFYEYFPLGEKFKGKIQLNMGGTTLLDMCKTSSKLPSSRLLIFIADADDKKIVDEMSTKELGYKKWAENVYSMVLPIPDHRKNEDGLCIEHLYTDNELSTDFVCKDGITRHLYFGNQFDKYGRGLYEQKICIKRNLCGRNSNKVIDGGDDARVISYDNTNNTNYALSKFDFAEKININPRSESYQAFMKVFSMIGAIIKDRYGD